MADRIYGDPERLAREAARPAREEAERLLNDALKAAVKIVEESIAEETRKAERTLEARYEELRDRVASVRARFELELKNRVELEKNKHADEAIRRAIERFMSEKHSIPEYREYLRWAVERIAEEARELGGVKLLAAPEDKALVAEIASQLEPGLLTVSDEHADIIGGVIAVSEKEGVKLDYSIDYILKVEEARLRLAALRALFP